MANQNFDHHVTAKQFNPPTLRDFMGRSWFRIYEGKRYKTKILAISASAALRIYSQQKNLSR